MIHATYWLMRTFPGAAGKGHGRRSFSSHAGNSTVVLLLPWSVILTGPKSQISFLFSSLCAPFFKTAAACNWSRRSLTWLACISHRRRTRSCCVWMRSPRSRHSLDTHLLPGKLPVQTSSETATSQTGLQQQSRCDDR